MIESIASSVAVDDRAAIFSLFSSRTYHGQRTTDVSFFVVVIMIFISDLRRLMAELPSLNVPFILGIHLLQQIQQSNQ